MGSARNRQPIFGFRGRLEERPAQGERDGPVPVAVNGQQGAGDAPDLEQRIEAVFHQQTHRQKRIPGSAHIHRGRKTRLNDESGRRDSSRHLHRDSGPQRFSKVRQFLIRLSAEPVQGRLCVPVKTRLGGSSRVASVSPVIQEQEAVAQTVKVPGPVEAICSIAAVATKIDQGERLFSRPVPTQRPDAVLRYQLDRLESPKFLAPGQRNRIGVREVLEFPLEKVDGSDQDGIDHQQAFQERPEEGDGVVGGRHQCSPVREESATSKSERSIFNVWTRKPH